MHGAIALKENGTDLEPIRKILEARAIPKGSLHTRYWHLRNTRPNKGMEATSAPGEGLLFPVPLSRYAICQSGHC